MLDMEYGVCLLPLIPGRKDPADASEMTTQLVYGEAYTVIEKQDKWLLVRGALDNYDCYIDRKQYFPIPENDFHSLISARRKVLLHSSNPCNPFGNSNLILPGGALEVPGKMTNYSEFSEPHSWNEESLKKAAFEYMGTPYLWGGKTVLGIDCSGFMQVVFRMLGINLPRDAWQQASEGETVDFVTEAKTGDLAFFDNAEGKITHVGLVINDGEVKIIHASGWVRLDQLDHEGIFAAEQNKYTHKLRTIKRLSAE